jgi:SAM-dependent methyltransferase
MTRRDACAALAFAASSAVAGAARADTAAISRAYDGYAASYDDLDGGAFAADTLGLDATRRALLAKARGDVLELGVGTGLNLPGYDATRVASLTAVDISQGMLEKAEARARTQGLFVDARGKSAVTFAVADAERLPFPDASFDCVVDTFSLCVFADPEAALAGGATRAEARRRGAARRAHQVQDSASAGRVPGPRRRAGDENEQGVRVEPRRGRDGDARGPARDLRRTRP